MNTQRKLTALLHELQHARSPLAQARVLARAWRTVRELSPTDRRLLARHAGFDGAEDILEGLSKRKGGLAPAMLLRVLANARATDGSAVSELLAAFRDPERRDEALSLGAELASDLLAEPPAEETTPEIGDAIEELQAVKASIIETPEEALAALNAPEPEPMPEPEPEAPPPPPVVDWSRWREPMASSEPEHAPREEEPLPPSASGSRRFEARAVMGALGAQQSVFSQLRVLRRELSGFAGSSTDTLRELIETFPDGWARRRALCALLETGIPAEARGALELVSCLGRELDRRWCLGLLARKGDLRGALLSRALDLVDSDYSKRRLSVLAG
jgi:hypothetical protein